MQPVIAESPATLTGWSARATSLREAQFGSQRTSLLALIGAIAALALIACANLANLTMAHAASRRAEWALRAALGGGRAAILRLQMAETSLLAATGCVAGLLLGAWILPALRALDPTTARTFGDVAIDWRVQAAMAALTGSSPCSRASCRSLRQLRGNVAGGIADGSRRAIGSRRDLQARQWLVGAECAAAVVLLASGAVLVSAFDRLHPDRSGLRSDERARRPDAGLGIGLSDRSATRRVHHSCARSRPHHPRRRRRGINAQ